MPKPFFSSLRESLNFIKCYFVTDETLSRRGKCIGDIISISRKCMNGFKYLFSVIYMIENNRVGY